MFKKDNILSTLYLILLN